MQVQVDLVHQYHAGQFIDAPVFGCHVAQVAQQVADPADEGLVAIGKGGEGGRGALEEE